MTTRPYHPLPAPGDIVYCRFPEEIGVPGPKPRPALVTDIVEFADGTKGVRVAYGTTKRVTELLAGEFSIRTSDAAAWRMAGLSYDTKFDLGRRQDLPYTDEWFRVPPSPRHGQTPKLGTVHPGIMRRIEAAYRAVAGIEPDKRTRN